MLVVSEKVGTGKEKVCYVHPQDSDKAIKLPISNTRVQTDREICYYRKLLKRKNVSYSHMPQFYGLITTNLGEGYVVDLVRDYDGEISKSLEWYLQNGFALDDFSVHLQDLKAYFLRNCIVFNHDMYDGNLLVKKLSPEKMQLVIIDGIGDVVFIEWLNNFSSLVRLKIERRWERFWVRLQRKVTRGIAVSSQ